MDLRWAGAYKATVSSLERLTSAPDVQAETDAWWMTSALRWGKRCIDWRRFSTIDPREGDVDPAPHRHRPSLAADPSLPAAWRQGLTWRSHSTRSTPRTTRRPRACSTASTNIRPGWRARAGRAAVQLAHAGSNFLMTRVLDAQPPGRSLIAARGARRQGHGNNTLTAESTNEQTRAASRNARRGAGHSPAALNADYDARFSFPSCWPCVRGTGLTKREDPRAPSPPPVAREFDCGRRCATSIASSGSAQRQVRRVANHRSGGLA